MCSIVVALVFWLSYWIIYCTGLIIEKKGVVLIVVVFVVVVVLSHPLLYYYYGICFCCWTIIIIIGWSIRVTCPFNCLLIWLWHGTYSLLLLLLIFYNLIYYYYFFKSAIHSDSNLSFSVVVDWDIPLSFEPTNCSINTKFSHC